MKIYGRYPVSEFLGDWIVYRNLVPVDSSLPSLADLGPGAGLAPGVVPRKIEPVHSQVIRGSMILPSIKRAFSLHAISKMGLKWQRLWPPNPPPKVIAFS